jgi:nucleoside-diphosphate-sugar epimerase
MPTSTTAYPSFAVTGASGFVGRAVLRALVDRGVDVVAVTREGRRLADFEGRARIVEGDVSNPESRFCDILLGQDVLLHLAWDGLPNYRSLHHFETELPKHFHFLKELVCSGLKTIVVTGTCFEYGMQNGELSETLNCRPANPYGFAKDTLRRQLEFLQTRYPFNLTWARLFYMYGEGQSAKSIYSLLSAAVSRGDSHFDMSGGEQIRDYLHVNDVASSVVQLSVLKQNLGVVNVCSGTPRSMRRLVESWLTKNNWKIELRLGRCPYPDFEPFAFWGNAEKLHALLHS